MKPICTAVIGFGLSGRVFHAPFIAASRYFALQAIVKRSDPDEVQAHYPDVQVYASVDEVCADPEIELAVVATPHPFHFEMASALLKAGKHVIIEKPCTATVEEANLLLELAESRGLHLFIYHNRRFDGDFKTVAAVVRERRLGKLVRYEARYDRYVPGPNSRGWKEEAGPMITVLHDLGTHIIDQTVGLFGRPLAVTAHLYKQRPETAIYDGFDLNLHYQGFNCMLGASCLVKELGPRYVLHGVNGSFVKYGIDPQEDQILGGMDVNDPALGVEGSKSWGTLHINGEERHIIPTLRGCYMQFYDNVAAVIRKEEEYAISPLEAIITVEIISACEESHKKGCTIELPSMK